MSPRVRALFEPRPPIERDRVAIELGLVPPYEGYQPVRWHRNRTGSVVHSRNCARRGNSVPWYWAEDHAKDSLDLLLQLPPWVRPCKICLGPAAGVIAVLHDAHPFVMMATRVGKEAK